MFICSLCGLQFGNGTMVGVVHSCWRCFRKNALDRDIFWHWRQMQVMGASLDDIISAWGIAGAKDGQQQSVLEQVVGLCRHSAAVLEGERPFLTAMVGLPLCGLRYCFRRCSPVLSNAPAGARARGTEGLRYPNNPLESVCVCVLVARKFTALRLVNDSLPWLLRQAMLRFIKCDGASS